MSTLDGTIRPLRQPFWTYAEKERAIRAIGDRKREVETWIDREKQKLKELKTKHQAELKEIEDPLSWYQKEYDQLSITWSALIGFYTVDEPLDY